jgi:hypothetical protein
MVMSGNNGTAQSDRTRKLRHLRELIAALDRRVPHVERIGEIAIAREGRALREKALQRIAELEANLKTSPNLSQVTSPSDNDDVAKRLLARRLGF